METAPVFTPRLDILPPPQRNLWDELTEIPDYFDLYGDTALALHLGHRQSIDFDFFASQEFDPVDLYRRIPFLSGSQVLQQVSSTLSVVGDRGGAVRISFFGVPNLGRIGPPLVCSNGVKVASILDLAGTKTAVVQQRAESKDYLDIAALLQHGLDLPTALGAARKIYGSAFNPQITLKALSFFGDGDLPELPDSVKKTLVRAVGDVDLAALPEIHG